MAVKKMNIKFFDTGVYHTNICSFFECDNKCEGCIAFSIDSFNSFLERSEKLEKRLKKINTYDSNKYYLKKIPVKNCNTCEVTICTVKEMQPKYKKVCWCEGQNQEFKR